MRYRTERVDWIKQIEGMIITRDKREQVVSGGYESLSVALNGNGSLLDCRRLPLKLNDSILAPMRSIDLPPDRRGHSLVIPLVGAAEINGKIIHADEFYYVSQGCNAITVCNHYDENAISFLEIHFADEEQAGTKEVIGKIDIEDHRNTLVNLLQKSVTDIFIGKFDGRAEFNLPVAEDRSVFLFNICGSFEVEGRLLLERDSVILWDSDFVSFESLEAESIILAIVF